MLLGGDDRADIGIVDPGTLAEGLEVVADFVDQIIV